MKKLLLILLTLVLFISCGEKKQTNTSILYGLSENERKEIFKELVLLEDKAFYEAEKKHPIVNRGNTIDEINKFKIVAEKNIDDNKNYEESLLKKYKSELLSKHKITDDVLEKISRESFDKNWELPKNPY